MIFSWKLSYSDFVVKIDSNSEDIFRGENLISKSTHRNVANETYDFFFHICFVHIYIYLLGCGFGELFLNWPIQPNCWRKSLQDRKYSDTIHANAERLHL